MTKLLIVGAGGHGKVVADTADAMAVWSTIAFLDHRFPSLESVYDWPVLGRDTDAGTLLNHFSSIVVALGDNQQRLTLSLAYQAQGFQLATLIHPRACVSKQATIGSGTVIFAQAVVNAGAQLGSACIINTGAIIEHDCHLGNGVHVSPNASLGGGVTVGNRSWLGLGCCIKPGLSIGQDVILGAGSVAIRPIADGQIAMGNPAKLKEY